MKRHVDVVPPAGTTKEEPSESDFDRAREEAFGNEGGAPKPDQDRPRLAAGERNLAREQDHPDAVRAGVRFPARRSGYPNNRITFDCPTGADAERFAAIVRRATQGR